MTPTTQAPEHTPEHQIYLRWLDVAPNEVAQLLKLMPHLGPALQAAFYGGFSWGGQYSAIAEQENPDARTAIATQTLVDYLHVLATARRLREQRDFLDHVCGASDSAATRHWRDGFDGSTPDELLWPSESGGLLPPGDHPDVAPIPPIVPPAILRLMRSVVGGLTLPAPGEAARMHVPAAPMLEILALLDIELPPPDQVAIADELEELAAAKTPYEAQMAIAAASLAGASPEQIVQALGGNDLVPPLVMRLVKQILGSPEHPEERRHG